MSILVKFVLCVGFVAPRSLDTSPLPQERVQMLYDDVYDSYPPLTRHSPHPNVRGFWDFVGNWLQASDWFPIQFNVPDTIGSIGNGITGFATGLIQRIPFIRPPPNSSTINTRQPSIVYVQQNTNKAHTIKNIQDVFDLNQHDPLTVYP